jgi:hypothetical protein
MPTLLVRQTMAALLKGLPLNTAIDSLREVLQRSGLGRVVQFHAAYDGDGTHRESKVFGQIYMFDVT